MLSGFPFRMVNELQGAYSICPPCGGNDADPSPAITGFTDGCGSPIGFNPISVSHLRSLTKGDELCRTLPSNRPHRRAKYRQPSLRAATWRQLRRQLRHRQRLQWLIRWVRATPSGTSGSPQLPISPYSVRPPIPTGGSEQPLGVGIQQSSGSAESTSPIPVPGSTVSSADSVYPGELRTTERPGYATIGSADLVSQPGILAQLFPNLLESLLGASGGPGGDERREPSGDGRVRDRGTGSSEQLRRSTRRDGGRGRSVGKQSRKPSKVTPISPSTSTRRTSPITRF